MKEMSEKVLRLASILSNVRSKYSEWLKNNMKNDHRSLMEDARDQKELQSLEIRRLFKIKRQQVMSAIISELETEEGLDAPQIIEKNEQKITDIYQSILSQGGINPFMSFVLQNHLKQEKSLINRASLS